MSHIFKIQFWDKSHIFKSKHLWLNSETTQLRAQVPSHATSSVKFRVIGNVDLRIGRHWKPCGYGLSKDMRAVGFINLTFQAHHEYNWEPRSKSSTAHHEYNWYHIALSSPRGFKSLPDKGELRRPDSQ